MINPCSTGRRRLVLFVALCWVPIAAGCSAETPNTALDRSTPTGVPPTGIVTTAIPTTAVSAPAISHAPVAAAPFSTTTFSTTIHSPARLREGEAASARTAVVPAGCPAYAQTINGDFDGDGSADQATIRGDDTDNRRIEVCLDGGAIDELPIGAATRYLAALDVQGDGTTEIIAATPGPADRASNLHVEAGLYARGADGLEPVTLDGQPLQFVVGVELADTDRVRNGLGCLDLDDVGSRQLLLVESTGGASAQTGDTVRWARRIIELDGSVAQLRRTDDGTFTHGRDDRSIELIERVSCGPRLVELQLFPPPPTLCENPDDSDQADVDGDGIRDTVYTVTVDRQHYLGVCLATGAHDWSVVSNAGFTIFDLDRDGVPEILSQGTPPQGTPSQRTLLSTEALRVDHDRIAIVGPALTSGVHADTYSQWSCRDVVGNALSEVEQLVITSDRAAYEFHVTTYRLTHDDLVVVDEVRSTLDATQSNDADPFEFSEAAQAEIDALAPACQLG